MNSLATKFMPSWRLRDEADIGRPIILKDIRRLMMLHFEDNRFVAFTAKPLVDALGQRIDLIVKMLVLIEDRPARRGDLDERKSCPPIQAAIRTIVPPRETAR